jgi:hypothetical protein
LHEQLLWHVERHGRGRRRFGSHVGIEATTRRLRVRLGVRWMPPFVCRGKLTLPRPTCAAESAPVRGSGCQIGCQRCKPSAPKRQSRQTVASLPIPHDDDSAAPAPEPLGATRGGDRNVDQLLAPNLAGERGSFGAERFPCFGRTRKDAVLNGHVERPPQRPDTLLPFVVASESSNPGP